MATCVARSTTLDALECAAKLGDATVDDLWAATAYRTYLRALSQQTEALFCDNKDILPYDVSELDTSLSVLIDAMAQRPGPHHTVGNNICPSARQSWSPLPRSPRLRQTRSCYSLLAGVENPRCSLPTSPRLPPPPARTPTPFRDSRAGLCSKNAFELESASRSRRTIDSLDVPIMDLRGRARTGSHPSACTVSPAPSIILIPPPSDSTSRRGSTISLLSSSSTEYSSEAPASYDAASESESVLSETSSVNSRPAAIRELVLEMFRDNYKEEFKAPSNLVSKEVLEITSSQYAGSEFLTIDTSEFLPSPMSFRPGAHGYIVPCTWTLNDMLKLQAECNYAGCHVFVTQGHDNAKYYGYYRIVQRDIPLAQWEWLRTPKKMRATIARSYKSDDGSKMSPEQARENLRKLDEGEDALYPVFFQFLFYDWGLHQSVEKRMKCGGPKPAELASESSSSCSEPETYVPARRPYRIKPSPLRIVTVDGINFEIAPTPVAWSHGDYSK